MTLSTNTVGIVVIHYNEYDRFLPQFIESVLEQTVQPDEIVIINAEGMSMGEARNKGVNDLSTDIVLYFSIDDRLLRTAIEDIKKSKTDVTFLRISNNSNPGVMPTKENIKDWEKHLFVPSYIAFKKAVWEKSSYPDSEFPNLPFLFDATKNGYTFSITNKPTAEYIKRSDSHSAKMKNKRPEITEIINSYL